AGTFHVEPAARQNRRTRTVPRHDPPEPSLPRAGAAARRQRGFRIGLSIPLCSPRLRPSSPTSPVRRRTRASRRKNENCSGRECPNSKIVGTLCPPPPDAVDDLAHRPLRQRHSPWLPRISPCPSHPARAAAHQSPARLFHRFSFG